MGARWIGANGSPGARLPRGGVFVVARLAGACAAAGRASTRCFTQGVADENEPTRGGCSAGRAIGHNAAVPLRRAPSGAAGVNQAASNKRSHCGMGTDERPERAWISRAPMSFVKRSHRSGGRNRGRPTRLGRIEAAAAASERSHFAGRDARPRTLVGGGGVEAGRRLGRVRLGRSGRHVPAAERSARKTKPRGRRAGGRQVVAEVEVRRPWTVEGGSGRDENEAIVEPSALSSGRARPKSGRKVKTLTPTRSRSTRRGGKKGAARKLVTPAGRTPLPSPRGTGERERIGRVPVGGKTKPNPGNPGRLGKRAAA
jgi:hypothetical protein